METIEISNLDSERFRSYLQEQLINRCKSNSSYSLRAYARDLSIDNSVLSKVLAGKRPLGVKLMNRLIQVLDVSPKELDKLVLQKSKNPEDSNEIDYQQIAIDSFVIISDWQHYAILELIKVEDFKSDISWIAKALNMKTFEVKAALDRLQRVQMIDVDNDGNYVDLSDGNSTNISKEMSSNAFRKMQKQLLQKSIDCIDKVEYEKRNNTSMTMAIDTKKIPEAVEKIKNFRREMDTLLSVDKETNEVYNLSIALCPLTNIENLKNKENL